MKVVVILNVYFNEILRYAIRHNTSHCFYRASIVIKENGQKVILSYTSRTQREALAKQLLTPRTDGDHTFGVKMVCIGYSIPARGPSSVLV